MIKLRSVISNLLVALTISSLLTPSNFASAKDIDSSRVNLDGDASDTSKAQSDIQVSPEKEAAINDLLEVTESAKRVPLMVKVFESNARKTFELSIIQLLRSEPKYKGKSRSELTALLKVRAEKMTDRYMELFNSEIDLVKLVRDISMEVYAKNFSVGELNDLVAFYKTPTGKKAMIVMPKLARESLAATQSMIRPKLKEIVVKVLEEEKTRLQADKEQSASDGNSDSEEGDSTNKTSSKEPE